MHILHEQQQNPRHPTARQANLPPFEALQRYRELPQYIEPPRHGYWRHHGFQAEDPFARPAQEWHDTAVNPLRYF